MDTFEVKSAPLMKRVAGYIWRIWYMRVNNQRRKRDMYWYRVRKELAEPNQVWPSL